MTVAAASRPRAGAVVVARRWGPWILLVVVVGVFASIGFQHRSTPTLDQRTQSLGARVRCPVCDGQNVNQSDTPPANAIRSAIRSELAAGESSSAVLDGIVRSYGPGILERPPAQGIDLLVWVIPVVAAAAGATGLVVAFRRWRPERAVAEPAAASESDRRLVDDALAEDDGR